MNAVIDDIVELAESMSLLHRGKFGGGDPKVGFHDYDVPYVEGDFGTEFDGLLRFEDEEFQAFVNTTTNETPGRRRFTAAHEFGHHSITHHNEGIRNGQLVHRSETGFVSDEEIEREADIFAAHFLIPTDKLTRRHKNADWGAREVLDTSDYFGTSITCAALRCQQALPGDSVLILWSTTEVKWQKINREWWKKLPARTIRSADDLVPGSATETVLKNPPVTDRFLWRGTTRAHWIKRIGHRSMANDILIEYAIPLGRYGVLTLLRPDAMR